VMVQFTEAEGVRCALLMPKCVQMGNTLDERDPIVSGLLVMAGQLWAIPPTLTPILTPTLTPIPSPTLTRTPSPLAALARVPPTTSVAVDNIAIHVLDAKSPPGVS